MLYIFDQIVSTDTSKDMLTLSLETKSIKFSHAFNFCMGICVIDFMYAPYHVQVYESYVQSCR